MTYPPGGQQPYEEPQYPGQPFDGPTSYPPPPDYPRQPPMAPPPPPRRKSKLGLILALVAVFAIAVVGVLAGGLVLTSQGKGPFASDEKRVEAAIRDYYRTLDADGFVAAVGKMCAADRAELDGMTNEQRAQLETAKFAITIDKIDKIVVSGDQATAHITGKLTMTFPGEEPDSDTSTDEHVKKEDGKWRVCSLQSGKN
ncbi:hypothetical protein [Nocardia sp. NPDC052566]|uniref:Rv0361 family membrane protein n=1 Tax=Nocardia sp. NPDC052566 TaxID=3364330 RepID=UPI0037C8AB44